MNVEQQRVGCFRRENFVGRFGAAGAEHAVAVALENPLEHAPQPRLVIDDQDGGRLARPVTSS